MFTRVVYLLHCTVLHVALTRQMAAKLLFDNLIFGISGGCSSCVAVPLPFLEGNYVQCFAFFLKTAFTSKTQ